MLKQDEPVNVKSNRLDYDGASRWPPTTATRTLCAGLTPTIKADTIVLDDKTGNLHATTNVTSTMILTEGTTSRRRPKSAPKRTAQPAGAPPSRRSDQATVADELLYEDAKHQATYTGNAHMSGPDGDVTRDKIELYPRRAGRTARARRGRRQRRLAAGDAPRLRQAPDLSSPRTTLYTMTGTPGEALRADADQLPDHAKARRVVFDRTLSTSTASGNATAGQRTRSRARLPRRGVRTEWRHCAPAISPSRTAGGRSSRASTSRSPRARSSACSAPTAPARPRRSRWWSG